MFVREVGYIPGVGREVVVVMVVQEGTQTSPDGRQQGEKPSVDSTYRLPFAFLPSQTTLQVLPQ